MIQAKIIEKTFDFQYALEERKCTDMLVIHHTGEKMFTLNKKNRHTLGIHLSGDF